MPLRLQIWFRDGLRHPLGQQWYKKNRQQKSNRISDTSPATKGLITTSTTFRSKFMNVYEVRTWSAPNMSRLGQIRLRKHASQPNSFAAGRKSLHLSDYRSNVGTPGLIAGHRCQLMSDSSLRPLEIVGMVIPCQLLLHQTGFFARSSEGLQSMVMIAMMVYSTVPQNLDAKLVCGCGGYTLA